jgi:DNA-binding NarL/FixJ family response regulator
MFRDSLKSHFEQIPNIEVVGWASSASEVLPLLQAVQPKLIILDLNMEWTLLCSLLEQIHTTTSVRTLIMADDLESSRVVEILRIGSHGVVPRRTTQELLTKSIHTVVDGGFWVSRAMVADFIQLIRESGCNNRQKVSHPDVDSESTKTSKSVAPPTSAASEMEIARLGLTRRELQIIGALVDAQTNKDIAATFSISEYTVKHHLTNIYDKLGVYNRVELVLFAMHRGLCAPSGPVAEMANGR